MASNGRTRPANGTAKVRLAASARPWRRMPSGRMAIPVRTSASVIAETNTSRDGNRSIQERTFSLGAAYISSVTTFLSSRTMTAMSIEEWRLAHRYAPRQFQFYTTALFEQFMDGCPQALLGQGRLSDRITQNQPYLFFHGTTVACRPHTKVHSDIIVQIPDRDARQGCDLQLSCVAFHVVLALQASCSIFSFAAFVCPAPCPETNGFGKPFCAGSAMFRAIAYARVSTVGQETGNQIREVHNASFSIEPHRIASETVSGSVAMAQRKGFSCLLNKLEQGDLLVVTKLDGLGRIEFRNGLTPIPVTA